jgi:NAD(P)-dependent dehydrogenase (short-subunit alcohol dehydrogenase family)
VDESYKNIQSILSDRGIETIDILISNAGILNGMNSVLEATTEDMISTFNTNVIGGMLTAQVIYIDPQVIYRINTYVSLSGFFRSCVQK